MTFQSTFPRGERRWNGSISRPGPGISIHVPSWGTTSFGLAAVSFFSISIHVPSWGTTIKHTGKRDTVLFQSTFPRGERPGQARRQKKTLSISIHVPSWGTTV